MMLSEFQAGTSVYDVLAASADAIKQARLQGKRCHQLLDLKSVTISIVTAAVRDFFSFITGGCIYSK